VSPVIVVVSWSQVEGLDNPNPAKDHRGGRPGRSATLRFATRPGLRRSYTTTRDATIAAWDDAFLASLIAA